jgi:hypothetical protein
MYLWPSLVLFEFDVILKSLYLNLATNTPSRSPAAQPAS